MNWQEDTSVWHQTGSYGRTRRFLIPMNNRNNIVIPRPIANDTATGQHVEESTPFWTPIRWTLTFEEDKC
jgi:hypothetical protein